jgi:hypothetical protein
MVRWLMSSIPQETLGKPRMANAGFAAKHLIPE